MAAKIKLTEQQKVRMGKGMRLAPFGEDPRDTWRRQYERIQRLVDEKWEREQKGSSR